VRNSRMKDFFDVRLLADTFDLRCYDLRRFFEPDFVRERVAGALFFFFADASAFFFCCGFPCFFLRDVLTGEVAEAGVFFGLGAAFLRVRGFAGFDLGAVSSDSISIPKTSASFSSDNASGTSSVEDAFAVTLSVAAVMSSM
jgi:hypothetical protein